MDCPQIEKRKVRKKNWEGIRNMGKKTELIRHDSYKTEQNNGRSEENDIRMERVTWAGYLNAK